jgi:hypothetical protein
MDLRGTGVRVEPDRAFYEVTSVVDCGEISEWQIDLSLHTGWLVPPGGHPTVDSHTYRCGNGAEDDRHAVVVPNDLNLLGAVEERAETRQRLPGKIGNSHRP